MSFDPFLRKHLDAEYLHANKDEPGTGRKGGEEREKTKHQEQYPEYLSKKFKIHCGLITEN